MGVFTASGAYVMWLEQTYTFMNWDSDEGLKVPDR